MSQLSVAVRTDLIAEIILRSGGRNDPVGMIENIIESFLERTLGDPDVWSDEHAEEVANNQQDDTVIRYGNFGKGYQWQNVFLPNSTALKFEYKSKEHFAEVRHQQIYYDGAPCSPSQFVRRVANNTSRNAWNDIWIKRPSDKDWIFANQLREG